MKVQRDEEFVKSSVAERCEPSSRERERQGESWQLHSQREKRVNCVSHHSPADTTTAKGPQSPKFCATWANCLHVTECEEEKREKIKRKKYIQ